LRHRERTAPKVNGSSRYCTSGIRGDNALIHNRGQSVSVHSRITGLASPKRRSTLGRSIADTCGSSGRQSVAAIKRAHVKTVSPRYARYALYAQNSKGPKQTPQEKLRALVNAALSEFILRGLIFSAPSPSNHLRCGFKRMLRNGSRNSLHPCLQLK